MRLWNARRGADEVVDHEADLARIAAEAAEAAGVVEGQSLKPGDKRDNDAVVAALAADEFDVGDFATVGADGEAGVAGAVGGETKFGLGGWAAPVDAECGFAPGPAPDAAGLAFEALTEARQQGTDVLIVDTAGRLHNKAGLMGELEKIVRVMKKVEASAPHAVLLVLDATVGQNALNQVEEFTKTAGVTGLVMTKLDGTARGGILVAIAARHKLPVHFVGVGEGVEDLAPFAARDFARAVAGIGE